LVTVVAGFVAVGPWLQIATMDAVTATRQDAATGTRVGGDCVAVVATFASVHPAIATDLAQAKR
jgi:hypothetical protein